MTHPRRLHQRQRIGQRSRHPRLAARRSRPRAYDTILICTLAARSIHHRAEGRRPTHGVGNTACRNAYGNDLGDSPGGRRRRSRAEGAVFSIVDLHGNVVGRDRLSGRAVGLIIGSTIASIGAEALDLRARRQGWAGPRPW